MGVESLNRLPQRFVYAIAGNAPLRQAVIKAARLPPETHHCTIFAGLPCSARERYLLSLQDGTEPTQGVSEWPK
jgi:hypothetical protein